MNEGADSVKMVRLISTSLRCGVFAGGVNDVSEMTGHAVPQTAYDRGKAI